jgi:hypothetical protein
MVPLEMPQCLAAAPSVDRVDMVWFPVVPFGANVAGEMVDPALTI